MPNTIIFTQNNITMQNDELNQPETSENFYYKSIRFLHSVIVNIRKNIVLFIICLLTGILPLVIKNVADSNEYKASFTVAYDELFRKIYGDRLEKINTLVGLKQTKVLSNLLKVDEKTTNALKSVEGKNILGEDLSKDLNTDHIPFVVELVVDDSSQIVPLQNSIVKFLETGNDFMAARKNVKLLENKEELEYINRQLGIIDTAYKTGNVNDDIAPVKTEASSGTANKTPGSLIEFSFDLYKRKQELLRRERMPQTLFILDDAIVSVEKRRPIALMVLAGTVIGLILYSLLAGIIIPAFKFKER